MDKADAQRCHAIARARLDARAGLDLTVEDYQWLTNCIRKQGRTDKKWAPVRFVSRQSNRVTLWDIQLPGRTLRAVYDNQRGRIVTFLPTPPRDADRRGTPEANNACATGT